MRQEAALTCVKTKTDELLFLWKNLRKSRDTAVYTVGEPADIRSKCFHNTS